MNKMTKIENIDLGVVTLIEKIQDKVFHDLSPTGSLSGYTQNMMTEKHEWRFEGFLTDPTQEDLESLENVRNHGLMCFIDFADVNALILGYGKLTYFRIIDEETYADLARYEGIIRLQSAIGLTHIQTANAFLHDLLYRAKLPIIDPQFGRFNKTWSSNRLELTYELYIDNYKAGIQDIVIEIQCGDDIDGIRVWGWKGAAWNQIGYWSDVGTPWGSGAGAWVDDDTISHVATADRGDRGETLGIGIISLSLGCKKRILLKLTNFQTIAGNHLSTKYGSHQLKLKVKLIHTQREASRPYPLITYVEGGLEQGVP